MHNLMNTRGSSLNNYPENGLKKDIENKISCDNWNQQGQSEVVLVFLCNSYRLIPPNSTAPIAGCAMPMGAG